MEKSKRKCVFAGTFDPPTVGHKATVEDCLKIFDEVVVAVLVNPKKQPLFTAADRKEMLELTFGDEPRVRITVFEGTVAELMQKEQTDVYVRGIRNGTDLDYENADFYASKKLNERLTAVYIPCRQELLHVSSSIVRNSLLFHTSFNEYVTAKVERYIREKRSDLC